jgi:hypothetical protein
VQFIIYFILLYSRSALKSNATDAFVVSAAVCGEPKYGE